jgi:hypothetical protein
MLVSVRIDERNQCLDGPLHLHYLYAPARIHFSNFMNPGLILVCTMNTIPLSVRGVCLTLLILAAIGHADSSASRATSIPHLSGFGRLGRDLVRRAFGEETLAAREAYLDSLLPPPMRKG